MDLHCRVFAPTRSGRVARTLSQRRTLAKPLAAGRGRAQGRPLPNNPAQLILTQLCGL